MTGVGPKVVVWCHFQSPRGSSESSLVSPLGDWTWHWTMPKCGREQDAFEEREVMTT